MEEGGFCGVKTHRNHLGEGVSCEALKLLTEGRGASPGGAGKGAGSGTHLHAVGEHDTHRHQLGEDLEQLWVGEHAVLQAVVQEARVVAQDIINVGCLWQERPTVTNQMLHPSTLLLTGTSQREKLLVYPPETS